MLILIFLVGKNFSGRGVLPRPAFAAGLRYIAKMSKKQYTQCSALYFYNIFRTLLEGYGNFPVFYCIFLHKLVKVVYKYKMSSSALYTKPCCFQQFCG